MKQPGWIKIKDVAREALGALFMRVLLRFEVVGWQGLEPWTNALKGHCSTN
jgi:hypothetical protein